MTDLELRLNASLVLIQTEKLADGDPIEAQLLLIYALAAVTVGVAKPGHLDQIIAKITDSFGKITHGINETATKLRNEIPQ